MGRGILTAEEKKILEENAYVVKVTERSVTYSDEFKVRFIEEYLAGKKPKQIFEDAGFDAKILGNKRIERACARWREAYTAGKLKIK